MKNILCFGDSNTWGYDPDETLLRGYQCRHPANVRWTGVMSSLLGTEYHVIEEGLCGRTTVHEDTLMPHRNGEAYLPACLESHKPVDLVIMMIGTNDLKAKFNLSPSEVAMGVAKLTRFVMQSEAGINNKAPAVLLVCPPLFQEMISQPVMQDRYRGAESKSAQLPRHFESLAKTLGCFYFNPQSMMIPSPIDGIHFPGTEHHKLGIALTQEVKNIFGMQKMS